MDWIVFLPGFSSVSFRVFILCVFPGQYSRRTVISNAGGTNCEKCRRKGDQQSQSSSEKEQKTGKKKKSGRPKGSKNKDKEEVVFTLSYYA